MLHWVEMPDSKARPLTVLLILDGFGYNANREGNAIYAARTPNLDWLWSQFPHTLLKAAEEEVGLAFGQIGNSEVGHIALGTGRVLPSPLERINAAVGNGSFFQNTAFLAAMNHVKTNQSRLHLIGMISTAGVHADVRHMMALLDMAKRQGIHAVFLHPILDGRDTGPKEALTYLSMLQEQVKRVGIGVIATIGGRSFGMDRNSNWSKIKNYYDALVGTANTPCAPDAVVAIQAYYQQGFDDESIPPTIIAKDARIADGDAIILVNFREDRMRQLVHCLSDQTFSPFVRQNYPKNILVTAMTEYEKGLPLPVAFSPIPAPNTLSEILERYQLRQLHISETEKHAHVTYFFNGGREEHLPHEDFVEIPSDPPELFLTHPAMQAELITNAVLEDIDKHTHDVIIMNFANSDMIGHTGAWEPTVRAVETIDKAVGRIATSVLAHHGVLLITADHGNAELKIDLVTRQKSKDHTVNPVPFIAVMKELQNPETQPVTKVTYGSAVTGILQDVAPTLLTILGLPVPEEMTGVNLIQ